MTTLTRMLLAASCAALALMAGEGPLRAQQRLKIGIVAPLSGQLADTGRMIAAGAKLYQELRGQCPLDHPIEMIMGDSTGFPDVARRAAQELIVNQKVDFLLGAATGPEALAIASLADGAKIPTVVLSGAAALPQRSRYFVRTSYDVSSLMMPLARFARESGSQRFATLAKEYASSLELADRFKAALESPQQVVIAWRTPVQNRDVGDYAGQVKNSNAEALFVAGLTLNDLRQLTDQFAAQPGSGGSSRIFITGELTDSAGLAQLGNNAAGLVSAWHYHETTKSADNDAFRKAFMKDNRDREPTADAVAAFDGMHLIYEALRKTGGKTDGDGLIEAMKGLKWESPRGAVAITADRDIDQMIHVRRVAKTSSGLGNGVVAQYRIDGTKVQGGSSVSGGSRSMGDRKNCSSSGGGGGPAAADIVRMPSSDIRAFASGTRATAVELERIVSQAQALAQSDSGRKSFGLPADTQIDPGAAGVLALGAQRVRPVEIAAIQQYLDYRGIKPGMPEYPDAVAKELLNRFPDLGGGPSGGFHPHQVRPGTGHNSDDNKMTQPGEGASGPAAFESAAATPAASNPSAPADTAQGPAEAASNPSAPADTAQGPTEGAAEGAKTQVDGVMVTQRDAIAVGKLIYPTPGARCTAVARTTAPESETAFHSGQVARAQKVFCRYGFTDVVFMTFPGPAGANLCSGAFLTPTHVLTAAHCGEKVADGTIQVFAPQAGRHDCLLDKVRLATVDVTTLTSNCRLAVAKVRKSTRTSALAAGAPAKALDLAVLELESVPQFDGKPIVPRLVELGPVTAGDTMEVTMVGYGLAALQDVHSGGTLQAGWSLLDRYVKTLLTSSADEPPLPVGMSGAGQRTLSCAGDSGAPVFAGRLFGWRNEVRRVVGVVSSGMSIGACQPDDRAGGSMSPLLHPATIAFICAATGERLPICAAK